MKYELEKCKHTSNICDIYIFKNAFKNENVLCLTLSAKMYTNKHIAGF